MSGPSKILGGRLPVEAGFNLRDFGGHRTVDGRHVKRGMLYRSGTMALLTEKDAAHLRSLGIRLICDFRRPNERAAAPTAWHGADVDYFCRDYSESSGVLGEMLNRTDVTAQDMHQAMVDLYRVIPVDHAESYRVMFTRMIEGQVPILINCTAGKDRTGVGAALLLFALGVPREAIIADYLATNDHADWNWLFAQGDHPLGRAQERPGAAWGPLLSADVSYIESLFASLEDNHGGMERYLTQVLGVDEAARRTLQDMLLD